MPGDAGLSPTPERKGARGGNVAGASRRRLLSPDPAEGSRGDPSGPPPRPPAVPSRGAGADAARSHPALLPAPPRAARQRAFDVAAGAHGPPSPPAALRANMPACPSHFSSPPPPPPLGGRRFRSPDPLGALNRGCRLSEPAPGGRERSSPCPARATPASSGRRARAERAGRRARARERVSERGPEAERGGLAARKRGGAMTRERVGAVRDRLAHLEGGAWGRGLAESPAPRPGLLSARRRQTLQSDGEGHTSVQAAVSRKGPLWGSSRSSPPALPAAAPSRVAQTSIPGLTGPLFPSLDSPYRSAPLTSSLLECEL